MFDFLKILIVFFDQNKIPYMLSGSVALSVYALPRFTQDFDFVVHLQAKDAKILADYFKEGYYCDEDAIIDAVRHKRMFNIIDYKTGFKADFIIFKDEPYWQEEFLRRKQVDFMDMKLYVVSPEDLLISKIIWIQQIQSSLQKEDIRNIAEKLDLDWKYIKFWLDKLNLKTFGLINK
jgi:hypothetical protein